MTVTLHDWPEGLLCSADHTNLKGSMQLLRNLHKNSPFSRRHHTNLQLSRDLHQSQGDQLTILWAAHTC